MSSWSAWRGRAGRGGAGELLDQALGDRGRDQRVAGGDDADRGDELFGEDVFEQEAAGAGAQCVVDVLVEVEGGEHQDRHRMVIVGLGEDSASGFEAVDVGHLDVHQHDVRMAAANEIDRVATVAGLADDADARLFLEDRSEARP